LSSLVIFIRFFVIRFFVIRLFVIRLLSKLLTILVSSYHNKLDIGKCHTSADF